MDWICGSDDDVEQAPARLLVKRRRLRETPVTAGTVRRVLVSTSPQGHELPGDIQELCGDLPELPLGAVIGVVTVSWHVFAVGEGCKTAQRLALGISGRDQPPYLEYRVVETGWVDPVLHSEAFELQAMISCLGCVWGPVTREGGSNP